MTPLQSRMFSLMAIRPWTMVELRQRFPGLDAELDASLWALLSRAAVGMFCIPGQPAPYWFAPGLTPLRFLQGKDLSP